jgi:hypothetical protein
MTAIFSYKKWIEITARGTSGDQVSDILASWKADTEKKAWTPVWQGLPKHQNPVLVICKSGYLTKGWCVQAGYWWVYDDLKGEYHPRRADDPVEWWRELDGEVQDD